MPRNQPKKKMGRPPIKVDWETVDKLCTIKCTQSEISSFLGINIDTLGDHCHREHGKTFSEYYAEKTVNGTISLRRTQYIVAVEGKDVSMLKWLGQQYLGQKSQVDQSNLVTHVAVSMDDIKRAMGTDSFIDITPEKKEIE